MARTNKQTVTVSCRHLGLAEDPFRHQENATDDHRCYLWMQRDRIDTIHQNNFCLSGNYRNCPWLQISLPCQTGARAVWEEKIAPSLAENGQKFSMILLALLAAMLAKAWVLLQQFVLWARTSALPATARLSRAVFRRAIAALASLAKNRQRPADNALPPRVASLPVEQALVAGESEDCSQMMRLGQEASRAGHRKEAHAYFSKAAALDPSSEEAWLWMAATTENPEEALTYLQKALTINPASGRARSQLAGITQPAAQEKQAKETPAVSTVGTGVTDLVRQGLNALDQGLEDKAYQFFTAATEADASNEAAWFWRAKTSTNLSEVINCLERVLELNPRNEKARVSLNWATDRQRDEERRQQAASRMPSAPVTATYTPKPESKSQPFFLHLGSMCYLIVGLLWAAPVVFPLLDETMASLYEKLRILPIVEIPYISSSGVELLAGVVPEFNLFYLVPLFIAVLAFTAMEVAAATSRAGSLYVALVTGVSIIATSMFITDETALVVVIAASVVAGVSSLTGRIMCQRRSRANSCTMQRPVVRGARTLT